MMGLPLERIKVIDFTQVQSDQFEFVAIDDPILEMATKSHFKEYLISCLVRSGIWSQTLVIFQRELIPTHNPVSWQIPKHTWLALQVPTRN
jgi:hypothetical protein